MKQFNDGWQFALGEPKEFQPVSIPHDWLIPDTNNLYKTGTSWYKRELDTNFLNQGQKLFLRFDGVYMDSTLYINDRQVGEWKYGYTAFEYEITDFVNRDTVNILLLKVDYKDQSSRWYTGAGVFRDIFLVVKNSCHFKAGGIYITTKKRDMKWTYEVEAEVETGGQSYKLRHTLFDAKGNIVSIDERGINEWDIDNPQLYTLRSELTVNGIIEDSENTRFGFRTIEFTTDRGFFLNGRHVKLNGVCLHHDLGVLGAAVYPDAVRRQLAIFKEMGVNALRTSHNPPAKIFMDIADETGFVVMSELLDTWNNPKTQNDYSRFFNEWVDTDAASWIRRDRNHPSLILWSVGNEISDTHTNAELGMTAIRRLMNLVKKHDPKGNAKATFCSNYMPWENTQKSADIIKMTGYNYAESLYEKHHAEHPDWIIYGGETCSTVQSRGVYHFPLSRPILADDDLQCSSLGNSSTSWGSKNVETCIRADRDTPFSMGQFIWAGQDYIGEPTPYHTKNSYFGQIDTAGFQKDSYYVFQSAWTDYRKKPMVHLFPWWDFSTGQMIDVRVCSNAPKVELFLDDESQGVVVLESKELGRTYTANWRISYRKGTLRAVALDEKGKVLAEECRRSFGDVDHLVLEEKSIGELIFVAISGEDNEGNPVENANRRVTVSVENGTLLGMDNGDSTDYDQYQTDSRRMFSGKLLAIVKPHAGKKAHIEAKLDDKDIPIRKIELTIRDYAITAEIFPPDATYGDLYWRLTDEAGIDSPLGKLTIAPDGKSAVLTPRGDGEVYIRCCAKNGKDHISLISQHTLTITGLGKPFLDPYSFVSAGLCNCSNVELTNGNERGMASLRGTESHMGFKDIDFGDYGSDEITLPLFPLERNPFEIEIWEGMPNENGGKICTVAYDKGSIWNTYQEVTYKLPRRLKGVTTLCLVFRQKVHVKGFIFTAYQKAFQKLIASEFDGISGDTYEVKAETVENIGNNVSIIFGNMDFGEKGAGRVELGWKSKLPKNSIQIIFSDGNDTIRKMIIVDGSASWTEGIFPLGETITGKKTVTLSFLPGCNIDLAWIRFIPS